MDKDDALFTLLAVLVHHLAKAVELVVEYLAVAQATRIIEQLLGVQVNLQDAVATAALRLTRGALGRAITRSRGVAMSRSGLVGLDLLNQRLLQRGSIHIDLLHGAIVSHQIINQGRRAEEVALHEGMNLIELHHIESDLHAHCRLELKRPLVLEGNELHGHTLALVERALLKLLQQQLGVGLNSPHGAHRPSLSLGREVGIVEAEVTVVHQISLKGGGAHRLDIHRHKGQTDVECISTTHLGLAIAREACRGHQLAVGRSSLRSPFRRCLSLYCRTANGLYSGAASGLASRLGSCLSLCSPLLSRPVGLRRDVVTIRLNHHTLVHGHRDSKAVLVLYQGDVLALKSCHYSASYFAEEAHFITYFHTLYIITGGKTTKKIAL